MSYAMAIASVRETDRGSIGGSLEKLCDDGLMKSGSDMSQSHWLRVVECQGRNRAGEQGRSESKRSRCECTYLHRQRQRQHGPGQTGRHSVCTAVCSSGVATQSTQSTQGRKTGAGGGRDRPLLLPPFTRVQWYIGRGLTRWTGRHNWHTHVATLQPGLDRAQGGVQNEKPGRPQH